MKILDTKLSTYLQYFLIYLMILIPGSCLFDKFLTSDLKYYAVLALYLVLYVSDAKYRKNYVVYFLVFLLAMVTFTRILNGGAGLGVWLRFAVSLCSVHFALCCDREHFLKRTLNVIVFFAAISIVFWALFCVAPSLVNVWPAPRFYIQSFWENSVLVDYYAKGTLYYSFLDLHSTRNCGIYTEPGVYQIVLNGALFLLLFWKNKMEFKSERQYVFYLTVLLIAIVTCQSTTGYLAFALILGVYFVTQSIKNGVLIKTFVLLLVLAGVFVLVLDYDMRGQESILYKQLIVKLFSSDGEFGFDQGTGFYRWGSIVVSLQAAFDNPLGIGFDQLKILKDQYAERLVESMGISSMAVFGIIPWIITNVTVFYPVFKKEKTSVALLFLLLFFNTTLAQTDWFYPLLMIIPIYYATQDDEQVLSSEFLQNEEGNLHEDLSFN